MFEVDKTYKTKSGKDVRILGEASRSPHETWFIGWLNENGSVRAMKWCKLTGKCVFEGESNTTFDLVMPNVALDLTFEEAQMLRQLLYCHITGPIEGPCGKLGNIGYKLGQAGVAVEGLPKLMPGHAIKLYVVEPK